MRFNARIKNILATVTLKAVMRQHELADGYPDRPKTLLINPSICYFWATEYWDSHRVLQSFGNGGKFTALTTTLFVVFGFCCCWFFVAQLPYTTNTFTQAGF